MINTQITAGPAIKKLKLPNCGVTLATSERTKQATAERAAAESEPGREGEWRGGERGWDEVIRTRGRRGGRREGLVGCSGGGEGGVDKRKEWWWRRERGGLVWSGEVERWWGEGKEKGVNLVRRRRGRRRRKMIEGWWRRERGGLAWSGKVERLKTDGQD